MAYPAPAGAKSPPNAYLARTGQIKGDAATWGPGAAGLDKDRALFLKLGMAEILEAYMTATVFKGTVRERSIRGGKSAAFPITGKMEARYHEPGTPLLGETNAPSDLNEKVINLDALMVADVSIYDTDAMMSYFDVRSIYTKELGRALAVEHDKRVARMIYAAAKNVTEPLAKDPLNKGRIGAKVTLDAAYTGATTTRQAKGDMLVDAIFDARVAMEKKNVPMDGVTAVCTPEAFYWITQSSRAINTDFNGGNGSNGTIAQGRTAQIAGIPLKMSNHVTQPAYALKAGDYSANYAQDLSKCQALVYSREAVGVLTLLEPSLQMTSGDFNVAYQSTLLVARMDIGMDTLRSECAVAIETA